MSNNKTYDEWLQEAALPTNGNKEIKRRIRYQLEPLGMGREAARQLINSYCIGPVPDEEDAILVLTNYPPGYFDGADNGHLDLQDELRGPQPKRLGLGRNGHPEMQHEGRKEDV